MRRILMILLLFLILGNSSFSQTTYPKIVQDSLVIITKEQLKLTNTIFLEHEKYSLQIPELERKLGLQQQTDSLLRQSLVVKDQQISNLHEINTANESILLNKDKELKKYKVQNKLFIIGGCTVCTSLIFLLIFK